MRSVSRREALILGGLGAAGVLAGGAGLLSSGSAPTFPRPGGRPFAEPEVLASRDGLLRVHLTAAPGVTEIGGRRAHGLMYNQGLPGPTLSVRPGDRLQVRLENRLSDPTNLHVHGLHVSPVGNGDNVFVDVQPGESFDYDHRIPDDHPPGVYWYHPHHHGMVADQVFGGLYGAIIVQDPTPVPVVRERVLVISDITLDPSGRIPATSAAERMAGREGELVLVNGRSNPRLTAGAGGRERWRIVNACTSRYLRLRLDGQRLQLLGIDSGRFPAPRAVSEVLLLPGNRADLLVTPVSGEAVLEAVPVDRGSVMGARPSSDTLALASLTVTGTGAASGAPGRIPTRPPLPDLRSAAVSVRRTVTFAMGMSGMGAGMGGGGGPFTIDGNAFDPNRVDADVRLGTVEEWTLVNTSSMDHPIHLHVWPMQLLEQGGTPVDGVVRQDVVNVPARGSTRVRIAFDDFTGTTVYHCHILDHEDAGMMATLRAGPAA